MPIRPYAPAGPSIHPTIYIPARGPFALCQAILIPIYHLFLAAPSFLSACSSSARPSFLNPSTPIGFFRGLSFGRLSFSLYPFSSLPRASSSSSFASFPCSVFSSPFLFLALPRPYAGTSANLFSCVVSSGPTHFLISGYLGEGGRAKKGFAKERHTTTGKELPKLQTGPDSCTLYCTLGENACVIRQRGKSIVRIAYYFDPLILLQFQLHARENNLHSISSSQEPERHKNVCCSCIFISHYPFLSRSFFF